MNAEPKMDDAVPTPRRSSLRWGFGLALTVGLLGFIGARPKVEKAALVEAQHQRALAPKRVPTAKATRGPAAFELTLPGSVAAFQSSVVYSRGAGFVRRFYFDLGDKVKAGQVLADIESPEVDQDLNRARARVEEAEKNETLSKAITERAERLAKEGVSSQQVAEESRSRLNTAKASVDSARAELDRLGALRGFSRVTAGFDGVITRRLVENGSLVSAGVTPMFELAQVETLKVTVDVPQSAAPSVGIGTAAVVWLPGAPAKTWQAKVSRTAGSLDPATRTLRVELLLSNDGALLAGSYVQVKLKLEHSGTPLVIPASALSVRAEGPRVWSVENGALTQRTVQLGRDLGKEIEVVAGLEEGAVLVLNPTDALAVGAQVDPVEAVPRGK